MNKMSVEFSVHLAFQYGNSYSIPQSNDAKPEIIYIAVHEMLAAAFFVVGIPPFVPFENQ